MIPQNIYTSVSTLDVQWQQYIQYFKELRYIIKQGFQDLSPGLEHRIFNLKDLSSIPGLLGTLIHAYLSGLFHQQWTTI